MVLRGEAAWRADAPSVGERGGRARGWAGVGWRCPCAGPVLALAAARARIALAVLAVPCLTALCHHQFIPTGGRAAAASPRAGAQVAPQHPQAALLRWGKARLALPACLPNEVAHKPVGLAAWLAAYLHSGLPACPCARQLACLPAGWLQPARLLPAADQRQNVPHPHLCTHIHIHPCRHEEVARLYREAGTCRTRGDRTRGVPTRGKDSRQPRQAATHRPDVCIAWPTRPPTRPHTYLAHQRLCSNLQVARREDERLRTAGKNGRKIGLPTFLKQLRKDAKKAEAAAAAAAAAAAEAATEEGAEAVSEEAT